MDSINCDDIKQEVKKIEVQKFDDEDVAVQNDSSLEMIGKGRQGAVFKINDEMCMKVYGEMDDCDREYYALSLGETTTLLPKVYCKGENFVVMEMVYGVDLREYLQTNPLTRELSYELIKMLLTFKEIGYERIDHHKRQIYLQEDGTLKVIDVGRTVWRNRTYPYPRKLLVSLGEEYKASFLEHVKEVAPELYDEWQYYMQMEEKSRQLYQRIQEKKDIDLNELSNQTEILLSTKDKKKHYNGLLNLVHKAIKEERRRELEKKQKEKEKRKQEKENRKKKQKEEIVYKDRPERM